MDPNQSPPIPSNSQVPPVASGQPINPDPPQSSRMLLYIALVGVVVLGGLFYYLYAVMNSKQESSSGNNSSYSQTVKRIPTPTVSLEQQQIQSLDTGDPTADISDIQKDVSNL